MGQKIVMLRHIGDLSQDMCVIVTPYVLNQKHEVYVTSVFFLFEIPGEKFPALRAGTVFGSPKKIAPFGRDFHCKINVLDNFLLLKELF